MTEHAFENYLSALENKLKSTAAPDEGEEEETLELALYHGLNLLAGYLKYPQVAWAHEGLHVLKVAELEFVLGNNADCLKHLERAENIIKIAMGPRGRHVDRIRELCDMLHC